MKMRLFIFFTICCITGLNSAQGIKFAHLSVKEGLSQNSVTSICQDSAGFLWFGTYTGLNRYDGYSFKIFQNDKQNKGSISDDFIRTLCVDKSGELWIGTMGGGINRYDRDKDEFVVYQHKTGIEGSLSSNMINSIIVDRNGSLWIGTQEGGISKIEYPRTKKTFENKFAHFPKEIKFTHYSAFSLGLMNDKWNTIYALYEDQNGFIWIGTRFGLSRYDPFNNKFKHYFNEPGNPYSLSNNNVAAVSEDKFGNIWIGTWGGGLNKYIIQKDRFIHYNSGAGTSGLLNNSIKYLFKDRENELWIGTWGGGLYKLIIPSAEAGVDDKNEQFISFQNNPLDSWSLSDNYIYSLFEDNSDVFWIGTDRGGLNRFYKRESKILHYRKIPGNSEGLNQNNLYQIHKDKLGILWIGTRDGGINIFDSKTNKFSYYLNDPANPNSLIYNKVRIIHEDREDRLWIGTERGLNEFDFKTKKFIRYDQLGNSGTNIFSIGDDSYNNIWIGTYEDGLIKLDKRDLSITRYRHNPNDANSISDNYVFIINEDRQGTLWIGTNNGGLNRYNRDKNNFTSFKNNPNDKKSISDNKILSFFQGASGQIWIGTARGLNKMIFDPADKQKLSFENFTINNGLPSNTIHGILEDDHGNLWISTTNGISKFNPRTKVFTNYNVNDGLQEKQFSAGSCTKDNVTGEMYFGGINGFNIFHPDSIKNNQMLPKIVITDFRIFNKTVPIGLFENSKVILEKSITETTGLTLDYNEDVFSLEFAALHFSSPADNEYAYIMEGFEKKWNIVSAEQRTATYTNLDPGEYFFRVKASNNDGIWNEKGVALKIIITPPFWQTWWFRLFVGLAIVGLFVAFHKIRTNRIREINRELEYRVMKRTEQLEETNKEWEAFNYSVSHDLRAPLRSMNGFSSILKEDYSDLLDEQGKDYLERICAAGNHMGRLIDDLLKLSRLTRSEMVLEDVNLSTIAESIIAGLRQRNPQRKNSVSIEQSLMVNGDSALLTIMLQNLFENAWKFTSKKEETVIKFGKTAINDESVFFIKDNGVGINMEYSNKLFKAFERQQTEFEGTGIGLATVKRVISRHGGKIWVEGKLNEGATFYFKLPINLMNTSLRVTKH
ncbi:MAG: two-component regulator propeller domain-containing protein [bacterium]